MAFHPAGRTYHPNGAMEITTLKSWMSLTLLLSRIGRLSEATQRPRQSAMKRIDGA